jgi:hypothetical protein
MRTSRCIRFFPVFSSGTHWNSTRGAPGSGGVSADPALHTSTPLWEVVSSSVAIPCSIIDRMNASFDGSTCQPRVSAHQSARVCGSRESRVTWNV